MIIIADIQGRSSAKIDASIGLLANVPEGILNKLRKKLGTNIIFLRNTHRAALLL